jgi:hypothetical protein
MEYFLHVNRTLPRLAVILAVLGAWLFASNHCALAALAAADEHACCHRTEDAPVQESMTECCQALSAPLPAVAAAPVVELFVLHPAWNERAEILLPREDVPACREYSAHGPPGAMAFAELVLQRSLLAHAPPVVVA